MNKQIPTITKVINCPYMKWGKCSICGDEGYVFPYKKSNKLYDICSDICEKRLGEER